MPRCHSGKAGLFIIILDFLENTENEKFKLEKWNLENIQKWNIADKINADKTILSPLCRETRIYET